MQQQKTPQKKNHLYITKRSAIALTLLVLVAITSTCSAAFYLFKNFIRFIYLFNFPYIRLLGSYTFMNGNIGLFHSFWVEF